MKTICFFQTPGTGLEAKERCSKLEIAEGGTGWGVPKGAWSDGDTINLIAATKSALLELPPNAEFPDGLEVTFDRPSWLPGRRQMTVFVTKAGLKTLIFMTCEPGIDYDGNWTFDMYGDQYKPQAPW